MLEVTITDTEKLLLKRTNLFDNKNIISFCLLLSYGKLNNLSNTLNRKVGKIEINVKEQISLLEEKIKEHKNVRIWYGMDENEDICNVYFLINYLSTKNVNIYLCNVTDEDHYGLGYYAESEIEGLLHRTRLLDRKEIEKYAKLWQTLEQENSEIRHLENGVLKSNDYDEFNQLIIKKLKTLGEIKQIEFIVMCMSDRLCGFRADCFFEDRINNLIKENKIIITKEVKELNPIGEVEIYKHIKLNI